MTKSLKIHMLIAGYVCAVVALVLFPPGFGLAAVAIGIIALVRDRVGHGIAIIVIGMTCEVLYLGPNALYLRQHDAHGFLERARSQ